MNTAAKFPTNTSMSNLSVSVAADPITAALDDAVEKLHAVVSPGEPGQEIVARMASLLQLVNGILAVDGRRDAVVEIVEVLAEHCDQCTVRAGIGKSKLTQLYDYRLGWLGAESSLHEDMSEQWDLLTADHQQWPTDRAACLRSDGTLRFVLPTADASGRLEIWVEGDPETIQPDTLAWLETGLETVGLAFWSRPVRSLPTIAVRAIRRGKLSITLTGLALLVLAVWPVHYRVSATSVVETTQQRIISAPFEATLLESKVRPGDAVSAGEVLFTLDGRPLRLERESIQAEIQQAEKEHNVALATGRIAEAQQAALRKQRLNRQDDLLADRLSKLEVVSPIDGVIVNGDLQRFEGSSLDRGQTLIEVAPMNQMVLEIEIPEHEVGFVEAGASSKVKLSAIGGQSMEVILESVYPRSELRNDQNVFIARAELDNTDRTLRPGMRGEATVYGPLRPWIWSWGRGAFEKALWWMGY